MENSAENNKTHYICSFCKNICFQIIEENGNFSDGIFKVYFSKCVICGTLTEIGYDQFKDDKIDWRSIKSKETQRHKYVKARAVNITRQKQMIIKYNKYIIILDKMKLNSDVITSDRMQKIFSIGRSTVWSWFKDGLYKIKVSRHNATLVVNLNDYFNEKIKEHQLTLTTLEKELIEENELMEENKWMNIK